MNPSSDDRSLPIKGRGALDNRPGRFAKTIPVWEPAVDNCQPSASQLATQVTTELAKTLITRNQSPDVPFNLSINPYRGCEHGCIYCFARPSHAYLDWSPGLDFETRLVAKTNAAEIFRRELSKPGYRCEPIALGISTDAYQPIERQFELTRQLLQVALDFNQPISIVTKGALILRDLDLLTALAEKQLVHVVVSVTTLDNDLKRKLEPRASAGSVRLQMIQQLNQAGVPVSVLIAPVIPFINDRELEQIVAAVAAAGACAAGYIMLRLPYEVAPMFQDWLQAHYPLRAKRVLQQLTAIGGGKLYNSTFGQRMRGQGVFAELINRRFHQALKQQGLSGKHSGCFNNDAFKVPVAAGDQLSLW